MTILNEEQACEILNLSQKFTDDMVRKAYLTQALRYHPDKLHGNSEKFKEINQAYNFLTRENRNRPVGFGENQTCTIEIFLKKMIGFFSPETDIDDKFINTSLKSILINCENISVKIFENLNLEKSARAYKYFCKYNDIFQISEETLTKMKNIIEEKAKSHNILVIKSSLDDLLNNKIYKLEIEEHDYYIPLWHKRFNLNDENKIMILNEYDSNENITIKDNNDIWIKIEEYISNVLDIGHINVSFGSNSFYIQSENLKITKNPQIKMFKNIGIPYVNKNDIYNFDNKSTVYVEILLV
jgi:curved DNA-binding protein CbpA